MQLAEQVWPLDEPEAPMAEQARPLAEQSGPLAEQSGPLAEQAEMTSKAAPERRNGEGLPPPKADVSKRLLGLNEEAEKRRASLPVGRKTPEKAAD